MYPHDHTVPSALTAIVFSFPTVISITFSNAVTFTGVAFALLSAVPSCPYVLFPHVHTVPSAFNATVCVFPTSTFGTDCFPSGTTFTNIVAVLFVILCVTTISAFPISFPVIIPSSSTVAMSVSNDINVILSLSTLSVIKLNLLSSDAFTCFVSFFSTDITLEPTFTYVSPITVNTFLVFVVPSPNSPYLLYPVVYTNPDVSDAIE